MTLQQNDVDVFPVLLKDLKNLLSGDNREENLNYMIQDCHEALSVFTLLLLLATQEEKCDQIGSQALTILLAMSCSQQVEGDTFGSLMTEKQLFDVF